MNIHYRALLLAGMLLLTACSETIQDDIDAKQIKGEIEQAFKGLADAARALDHERYFSYFDRGQYTALNGDGTVLHSFSDFSQMYTAQIAYVEKYNNLAFHNVKIDVINDATALTMQLLCL